MKDTGITLGAQSAPLTPEVIAACVGAVHHTLAPQGELPAGARSLVEALGRRLAIAPRLDETPPASPQCVAAIVVDPVTRVQLVRVLIAAAMMDRVPTLEVVARIEILAALLEVEEPALVDARLAAEGKQWRLRLHLMRRFWAVRMMRDHVRRHGVLRLARILLQLARLWGDRALARRYRALAALPEGTLGRRYLDFVDANGFRVHGERGALPEIIVHHDLSHVLAGYGTDPESEVEAACFQAGYRRRDPFTFVMFVLFQFHLGVQMTPAAKADRGRLDPDRALDAIRRGAAMNRDLTDGTWDYWAAMARPVAELHARYNLPAPEVRRAPQPAVAA